MSKIFDPTLGPTFTVACTSRRLLAEICTDIAFNGWVLFVVVPTGGGFEITVCEDHRTALEAAHLGARNLCIPRLPDNLEGAFLEQA